MSVAKWWGWVLAFMQVTAAFAAGNHAALGTSAAVDAQGRLWIAYAESEGAAAHVILQRSDDGGATWQDGQRVTSSAEPVAADGENRPKLAFGLRGEIYVTWTSPTSAQFTGDVHFARSLDGGRSWSQPLAVHHDRQLITHRFESLLVDGAGRIWVAWIDKRDLKLAENEKRAYAGAAIYYAYSDDRGTTWHGDFKLADHSCECCRIALARDGRGQATALWRHVFESNERDHAFAVLGRGDPIKTERVTFDRWRIDACPHHGPSLAFGADGTRHAVWFNEVNGESRALYGRLTGQGPDGRLTGREPEGLRQLPGGATHADVSVAGSDVAIAWKRFDGEVTRVETWLSHDSGRSFGLGPTAQTAGESDQPRLVSAPRGILLVWRRAEGVVVQNVNQRAVVTQRAAVKPFQRDSLAAIEREYAGRAFWLVLWDMDCPYCMKSLGNLAAAQRSLRDLTVVTVATDPIAAAPELGARLAQLGIRSDAYAFAGAPREALQFAIDPQWLGEKPRAYRYSADGQRRTVRGVIDAPE